MNPSTGHLVSIPETQSREERRQMLRELERKGYEPVPPELERAVAARLAGKEEAIERRVLGMLEYKGWADGVKAAEARGAAAEGERIRKAVKWLIIEAESDKGTLHFIRAATMEAYNKVLSLLKDGDGK